jgi:hypothetical protein
MPSILGANSASDYEISNSLRAPGATNNHLSMVFDSAASDANRRIFTFSGWIKLGNAVQFAQYYPNQKSILLSTDAAQSTTSVGYGGYTSANAGGFHFQDGRSGTYIETTSKFRDPSAWYHVVVRYDSTQGTASNRIFIYVNGVSQPLNYSNTNDPEVDQNTSVDFFSAGDNIDATSADSGNFVHNVNSYYNGGFDAINNSFDGYFADFHLINAQSLAPTAFGKTDDNGVWVPIKYAGSFNAHSFKLEFKQTGASGNSSGMGADTSGQDNHFKVGVNSALAANDVTVDTPTNNFCTGNPIDVSGVDNPGDKCTFSEGNTKIVQAGSSNVVGWKASTIGIRNGKWYFEVKLPIVDYQVFGVGDATWDGQDGAADNQFSVYIDNGSETFRRGAGVAAAALNVTSANNDIWMFALDLDSPKLWIGHQGTWLASGDPAAGSNPMSTQAITDTLFIGGSLYTQDDSQILINTGNPPYSNSSSQADDNGYGDFEYDVPAGFYSICTKNLAEFG